MRKVYRPDENPHYSNDISSDNFPAMAYNGFLINNKKLPADYYENEFILINSNLSSIHNSKRKDFVKFITKWNGAKIVGNQVPDVKANEFPDNFEWLNKFKKQNIRLLVKFKNRNYCLYSPLYHLLPKKIVEFAKLPVIKEGTWPHPVSISERDKVLSTDYDERLSRAFLFYIWKYLSPPSPNSSNNGSSIRVLTHNLDFWLPPVNSALEEEIRLNMNGRDKNKTNNHNKGIDRESSSLQESEYDPLNYEYFWCGEKEADNFAKKMVDLADRTGKIRETIEAIKTNRMENNFSDKWVSLKRKFEKQLLYKDSSYNLIFIEFENPFQFQSAEYEYDQTNIWTDFMSLVNDKEKLIVVLITKGILNSVQISKHLLSVNNSHMAKKINKIQRKVFNYLEN